MTNYSNAKKSFNLQLKSCNPQGTVAIRKVGWHPQSMVARLLNNDKKWHAFLVIKAQQTSKTLSINW